MIEGHTRSRLFYDEDDYRLLHMVEMLSSKGRSHSGLRKLFDPYLHPRGIKELAAPKSMRIATAMIDLLSTLEKGSPTDRVAALRAVRDEVLHDRSNELRINAARVLLQIMKEIVRSEGDEAKQLGLARDFREASSGQRRKIRKQLTAFHLLEMPEEWNQLAFDDHVHDANTKGRKSPTHLIMDAWIKGIRSLGVVYYHHVRPEAAAELLEAAEIMGIEVRIGVEMATRQRGKYIALVWAPRGFMNRCDFLKFLAEPLVESFMKQGREVADYKKTMILSYLESFNRRHLKPLCESLDVEIPPLSSAAFLAVVGGGVASLVHLAYFIQESIVPHLKQRVAELQKERASATPARREYIDAVVRQGDELFPETIVEKYLRPELNPDVENLAVPADTDDVPELLRLDPAAMLDRLDELPCRSRVTLNPSNLSPSDVLEVLYDGKGRISHIEIFNSKDWAQGRTVHRARINEIRLVINSGNIIEAKRLVRDIMRAVEAEEGNEGGGRIEKLSEILRDLPRLLDYYSHNRLVSRLGSDSIGRSRSSRGMGFVVVPTLPRRARRQVRSERDRIIPVVTVAHRHTMTVVREKWRHQSAFVSLHASGDAYSWTRDAEREVSWSVGHNTTTLSNEGNIATLGGLPGTLNNGVSEEAASAAPRRRRPELNHANTGLRNIAKIVIGFLPAFATFYLTKDWWVLAYLGAPIWFGITGLRNIIQSVVGGGGLMRNSLLHWKDFVSWGRVADSLLFTGFSVPLLDFFVKDLMLARGLHVTTATNPIALYTFIALANGIYLSSHNAYRGLPASAIAGNFFRTVFSIPIAVGLNFIISKSLCSSGFPLEAVTAGLQLWAAVISKTASDMVAAIIEGIADRQTNLGLRAIDYREKLEQVYDAYARLEMTFPDEDVADLLDTPKEFFGLLRGRAADVLRLMVVNALDLLYFWMYQPRAETALKLCIQRMSREEVRVLQLSLKVLTRKRIISEMLLDGLVGKRFERPLAFYLARADRYLEAFTKMARRKEIAEE